MELCGGIHVDNTADIWQFKITGEYAVASGIRRIEAITSDAVKKYYKDQDDLFGDVKTTLKNAKDPVKAITSLQDENAALKKQIEALVKEKIKSLKTQLKSNITEINGINFLATQIDMEAGALKDIAETPREKEVATPAYEQPRRRAQSDPKAEEWAAKNTWFGNDSAMTHTALDLHKVLVEEEGYDPKSDEYYAEVDKRIRLEFPHKFDKVEDTTTERVRPTQNVASAKRSASTGRRKTVKLTPSQVAIAKRLGVPLEDYAKQLKITEGA